MKTLILLTCILLVSQVCFAGMTEEYKETLLRQIYQSELLYQLNKDEIADLEKKPILTTDEQVRLADLKNMCQRDKQIINQWITLLQNEGVVTIDNKAKRDTVLDEMIVDEDRQIKEHNDILKRIEEEKELKTLEQYQAEKEHWQLHKKVKEDRKRELEKLKLKDKPVWLENP